MIGVLSEGAGALWARMELLRRPVRWMAAAAGWGTSTSCRSTTVCALKAKAQLERVIQIGHLHASEVGPLNDACKTKRMQVLSRR